MKPFTVRDVARAAFGNDAFPVGTKLQVVEQVMQIALQTVIGRDAAFSDSGECRIDLGNGFILACSVEPKEGVR